MRQYKYTVKQVTQRFRVELKEKYSAGEIRQIIQILFEHVLGFSPVEIVTRSDEYPGINSCRELMTGLEELKNFRPIQYITGKSEFYGLQFSVNPSVLIPRPETEELVKWILETNMPGGSSMLDIGTGSGCIAITLAKNLPGSRITGTDILPAALALARENAEYNNVRVFFTEEDILQPSQILKNERFDLIVSNPPYIPISEKGLMNHNVIKYEPHAALFVSDEDPFLFYSKILVFSQTSLKENGYVFFEINERFSEEIADLMKNHNFADVDVRKDINNKLRMIRGRKTANAI